MLRTESQSCNDDNKLKTNFPSVSNGERPATISRAYLDILLETTDQVLVPPLEGFVMERVTGDYFEILVNKLFVPLVGDGLSAGD